MQKGKYKCELCEYSVSIRSTVKTGENKGKKVCSACKTKQDGSSINKRSQLRPFTEKSRAKRKEERSPLRETSNKAHESWEDIPDYIGYYQASSLGRIRSVDRKVAHSRKGYSNLKGRVLRHKKNPQGYYTVNLSKDGDVKTFQVHQLVALVFTGHTIDNYTKVVDHIDGDRLNNRVTNLRSVSQYENTITGRRTRGGTSPYIGVRIDRGRVRAKLMLEGQHVDLGYFQTEELASAAYQSARAKYLLDKPFYAANIKHLKNSDKREYLLYGNKESPHIPPVKSGAKTIRKSNPKTVAKRREERKGYPKFFQDAIEELKTRPFCENCGCRINDTYLPSWNISHILPKSKYKSVATHPENFLILCAAKDDKNGCHEKFDSAPSNMVEMKCFTTAVKKFEKFKDKVLEKGKLFFTFEDQTK